jgi:hypothetical protein
MVSQLSQELFEQIALKGFRGWPYNGSLESAQQFVYSSFGPQRDFLRNAHFKSVIVRRVYA